MELYLIMLYIKEIHMFQIYIFTKSAIITEMELSVSLYYKMYQQNKNSKRISDNKTHRRKLIFMRCVSVLMGLPSATLAWYKQPPAMRVCIKSYTKKSPIVLQ